MGKGHVQQTLPPSGLYCFCTTEITMTAGATPTVLVRPQQKALGNLDTDGEVFKALSL